VNEVIGIVTDSTSDVPPDLAAEHNIYVVPAILVVNGRTLLDGSDISRDELYDQLPDMKVSPTTAAPSIAAFQQAYEELLKKGADQVISIHVSSTLSSMYNTALLAAKAVGRQVHVIDSRQVTLGLGFQVLAAAQAATAGQTLADIQKILADLRQRIHLVAMLDTLEYAYRSGRISWARSNISSLLRIKPFVGVVDGNVIRMGEARTRQKGIDRLYKLLSNLGALEQLAVLHTNAETDAIQVVDHFKSVVRNHPLIINVTSLIGVHVGPNGLGFVAVPE
jgi:DegV family protein with EDD domain